MDQRNLTQSLRYEAIQSLSGGEQEKINWMLNNMHLNKTFRILSDNLNDKKKHEVLDSLKDRYIKYRQDWKNQPRKCFEKKLFGEKLKKEKITPLCVDIEIAAICDLACPFCYRQYVATPDKIMDKKLAFKLIDQASEMNVPSMKFNWRGEPLLKPKLPEIISYAKSKGILETIINTNATQLDTKLSKKIISSGHDLMIISFDGGTKKNYEKMRPGRFKKNNFESVIKNISNFSKIKKEMRSVFPRTKIQMILTQETRKEGDEFFNLFKDIVDDVSVKQYSERGGRLKDIDDHIKGRIKDKVKNYNENADVMVDIDNTVFVSEGRLPCEQPFQRILITYDGRVSMCCYDWGSNHIVGYADDLALKIGDKDFKSVLKDSARKKKGFEMMNLKLPKKLNQPQQITKKLNEIWYGEDINKVRELHVSNNLEKVTICKGCKFKDTYKWKTIN